MRDLSARPHRELRSVPRAVRLRHAATVGHRVRRHDLRPRPGSPRRRDAHPAPRRSRPGRRGQRARQRHRRLPVGRPAPGASVRAPTSSSPATALPASASTPPSRLSPSVPARSRWPAAMTACWRSSSASAPRHLRTDFTDRAKNWPIVVDCGTGVDGLHWAIRATEPEGTLHSVSYYGAEPTVPMPLGRLYTLGINVPHRSCPLRGAAPRGHRPRGRWTPPPRAGDDQRDRLGRGTGALR